jgi:hypothetical protein
MNVDTYQTEAAKTLVSEFPVDETQQDLMLVWAAIGLAAECAGEVLYLVVRRAQDREKTMDEIGDCLWYAAALCTNRGWNLREFIPQHIGAVSSHWDDLIMLAANASVHSGIILETVKKAVLHRHGIDDHVEDKIRLSLYLTLSALAAICLRLGLTVEDVMAHNNQKLSARYSDGFSREASIARVDTQGGNQK